MQSGADARLRSISGLPGVQASLETEYRRRSVFSGRPAGGRGKRREV